MPFHRGKPGGNEPHLQFVCLRKSEDLTPAHCCVLSSTNIKPNQLAVSDPMIRVEAYEKSYR